MPKAKGLSIRGRGGASIGDLSGERLSPPLATKGGGGSRRQPCFASSKLFFLSSISESLRYSFGKSLHWVLLSVPCWMVDSRGRGSDSIGSLRLPPLSYRVPRREGLGAVGRFPAARPFRRVGSGALGFLRLVFAMMIIKDCVRQMWFMTMTNETEHIKQGDGKANVLKLA